MSTPTLHAVPGGYHLRWETERCEAKVTRLDDRDHSTTAEVLMLSTDTQMGGHLHQGRVNLTSTRAKQDLARALNGRDDSTPWADVVEALCVMVLKAHRQGEPIVTVGTLPLSGKQRYRLWPMCPEGVATVLFGEGGTGKSMLATLAAILVQMGGTHIGLSGDAGTALYLDYETSPETLNERVKAICAGLQGEPIDLLYRYSYHPLADDLETLQDMVTEHHVDFLVVDSLGPACGGDPNDAALTIRMFNALRELRVTALLIDHVAKNQLDSGKASPYGSVYKVNLARSVWQIKPGERKADMSCSVGLYHRKANLGPLRRPMGLTMQFTNNPNEQLTSVQFETLSVFDDAELSSNLPVKSRILAAVRTGAKTAGDIAEELGIETDQVRARLNDLRKAGQVTKIGETWGRIEHERAY